VAEIVPFNPAERAAKKEAKRQEAQDKVINVASHLIEMIGQGTVKRAEIRYIIDGRSVFYRVSCGEAMP